MPCKNYFETGECKFGEGCSFFHNDEEKRNLIDPLPNLPEGVTLPPMPEKLKNYKAKKAQQDQEGYFNQPQYYSPQAMPPQMIQLSSLTDIMALGGFNPNKYLTPQPQYSYGFGYQGYGQVPPHMMQQPMPHYGNPQPFNGQNPQNQNVNKSNKNHSEKKGERKEKKSNNK
jgi:hypothetical protein